MRRNLSLLKKQLNSTMSLMKHSDYGLKMVKSLLLLLLEDTEDIKSPILINLLRRLIKESLLSMPESPHLNNYLVSKIKSHFLDKNIQNIDLLKILVAESTSNGRALLPFWNSFLTTISKKLWLPTTTDLQDLEKTYFIGSSQNTGLKSWSLTPPNSDQMNKNLQKISLLSQLFSPLDTMAEEDQRYARKIRFYPTKEQKMMLNKQFGLSRYYYNKTVDTLNKDSYNKYKIMKKLAKFGCIFQDKAEDDCCCKPLKTKFFCEEHENNYFKYKNYKSKIDMRNYILKDDNEDWKKNIPFDSKTLTINNAIDSQKSALSNLKRGNINKFKMGFRTKKDNTQIFKIDYRALKLFEKNNKIQLKLFDKSIWKGCSEINIKNKKDLKWLKDQFTIGPNHYKKNKKKVLFKKFVPCDFSIKYESPGYYYLCVPSYRDQKNEKAPYELASLDPGIRTFQTFYSPEGIVGKIGDNTVEKLAIIGERIDKLISNLTKVDKESLKAKIKRRCSILRTKIKNIVKDLHWKTASYLCKNFENIIIPTFKVKEMTQIGKRKINNKTVRKMLALSHYEFKEKLKSTAKYYGRKVYKCSEAYTSKTCGNCGEIDDDLGAKKKYKCRNCKIELDRDINGARNILLRQLSMLLD